MDKLLDLTRDFDAAKAAFEAYLDEYDRADDKIHLKIVHTYGVVDASEDIARRMGLTEEDVQLEKVIGLLHDIGRFEQIRRFDSFEPVTMEHAAYGAQLLFGPEKMIRRFVKDDRFDSLICTAIEKHSDFKLEGITDERILIHAKLIRDADKLDNCRVKLEDAMETLLDLSADEVGKYAISPKVREDAFAGKCICSKDRKYFSGASGIKISDNEHPLSDLGDTEIRAVKHHPFHAVPQVIKRGEDDRKRPAFVMRQQSRNVFEQKIRRSFGLSQSGNFKEESAAGVVKALSSASD